MLNLVNEGILRLTQHALWREVMKHHGSVVRVQDREWRKYLCCDLILPVFTPVALHQMHQNPFSDGAAAPQKKKNPNRLIVDDAVNDDNSVSIAQHASELHDGNVT